MYDHVAPTCEHHRVIAQAERGAFLGISKKDAGLRRRELLGTGTGSLAEGINSSCRERARELLRSKAAGDLLVEVDAAALFMLPLKSVLSAEAVSQYF